MKKIEEKRVTLRSSGKYPFIKGWGLVMLIIILWKWAKKKNPASGCSLQIKHVTTEKRKTVNCRSHRSLSSTLNLSAIKYMKEKLKIWPFPNDYTTKYQLQVISWPQQHILLVVSHLLMSAYQFPHIDSPPRHPPTDDEGLIPTTGHWVHSLKANSAYCFTELVRNLLKQPVAHRIPVCSSFHHFLLSLEDSHENRIVNFLHLWPKDMKNWKNWEKRVRTTISSAWYSTSKIKALMCILLCMQFAFYIKFLKSLCEPQPSPTLTSVPSKFCVPSLINPFNKSSLSTHYVPGTGNEMVNSVTHSWPS